MKLLLSTLLQVGLLKLLVLAEKQILRDGTITMNDDTKLTP